MTLSLMVLCLLLLMLLGAIPAQPQRMYSRDAAPSGLGLLFAIGIVLVLMGHV
jgi:hypothetical protein